MKSSMIKYLNFHPMNNFNNSILQTKALNKSYNSSSISSITSAYQSYISRV